MFCCDSISKPHKKIRFLDPYFRFYDFADTQLEDALDFELEDTIVFKKESESSPDKPKPRNYFPETWMWEENNSG